jgi:hypothetical protein
LIKINEHTHTALWSQLIKYALFLLVGEDPIPSERVNISIKSKDDDEERLELPIPIFYAYEKESGELERAQCTHNQHKADLLHYPFRREER